MDQLLASVTPFLFVVGAVLFTILMLRFSGLVRYIPNDKCAVLEKLWSPAGSVKSGLIALNGEAGYQAGVLRGGFHFFFPFQYRLHIKSLVTIEQGKIGYLFARDGKQLAPSQTLASNATANDFQDVRDFLANGGQKGPQRTILREGTYAFNLAQFVIVTEHDVHGIDIEGDDLALFKQSKSMLDDRDGFTPIIIKDNKDMVGVMTVHDGPSLPSGEIIAPTVGDDYTHAETFHNNFQDPEKFLVAKGFRGRQYQVLTEGTYYINRLFATVEAITKTVIEVSSAGVVVSYTGKKGEDRAEASYTHGNLVDNGCRGVWKDPLLPGKYAFNTYAGEVKHVPTTNFILKWQKGETGPGDHNYDQNLTEVTLITKDAFEPSLPLSVVVSIDYRKAPLVIQRFGDVKKLVEQTLDPMVSAYFKNIAQTKTLIELLQSRSEIQRLSSEEMRAKFALYNLELHEVLIGTPKGSDQVNMILNQLRDRQVAVEKTTTFEAQKLTAVKERELNEAMAIAEQQPNITKSNLSIVIQENEGKAKLANARQTADVTTTLATADATAVKTKADGDAHQTRVTGDAEAGKLRAIGLANGDAIKAQVEAYGDPKLRMLENVMGRLSQAIEVGQIQIVPRVLIQGGTDGNAGGNNALMGLISGLMSEKLMDDIAPKAAGGPGASARSK